MERIELLKKFTPDDLITIFIGLYNKMYGDQAGIKILQKVVSSPKIKKFTTRALSNNLDPGNAGFITIINSIPYFFISKGETLCCASLWAIKAWMESTLKSEQRVKEIVISTILKAEGTKINISGNPTFFDNFYAALDFTFKKEEEEKKNKFKELDVDTLADLW
ncbi:MAG: hypothetical protein ACOX2Q_01955 [Dehalobacterium sp.]